MSKLKKWWKKLIGGSNSGSPSPAPAKIDRRLVEDEIDRVVIEHFAVDPQKFSNLINFKADIKFWRCVIKAICFAESSFNPRERFFEDSMGYYSEGLMQLSYEDCSAYGYPLNKSKDEIFDIEKNITLGMIILNRLVGRYGKFIFNSGNYWAVLQPKNKRHKIFLNKFNDYFQGGI